MIPVDELKTIANDLDDICVRLQNIDLEQIDKWDRASLIHNISGMANVILKQAS